VDAIQGLGVLPVDVGKLPIDFLATGAHKWLLGPQGAGALYIRRELLEHLHPVGVGAHSVRDPFNYDRINFELKPHAGRYEGGTLNFGGFAAWGASLALLEEIGAAAIEARVHGLSEERVDLLRQVVVPLGNVEVKAFEGLSVRFVREVGARVMLRGLRTLSDMEYEFHMSLTNRNLDAGIETVFLMAQVEYSHFSSTLIRHIGLSGGDLDPFLPPEVQAAVRARVKEYQRNNPPSDTS